MDSYFYFVARFWGTKYGYELKIPVPTLEASLKHY